MVCPLPVTRCTLTGRTRYRRGWFGRIVLQVEVEVRSMAMHLLYMPAYPSRAGAVSDCTGQAVIEKRWQEAHVSHSWRDATVEDALAGAFEWIPAKPSRSGAVLPPPKKP